MKSNFETVSVSKNRSPFSQLKTDSTNPDYVEFSSPQIESDLNSLTNSLQLFGPISSAISNSNISVFSSDASETAASLGCSPSTSFTSPESNFAFRRSKTTKSPIYPHKTFPRRSKTISSSKFQPITSASYSSLPSSEAVSYLSSFADSSALDLLQCAPDDEGEEVGKFVMGKLIGHGAFSTVREAYTSDPVTGEVSKLAVKIIRKDDTLDPQPVEDHLLAVENEVVLWKQLHNPYILNFFDKIETDYAEFVFMELCPNGNLLDHVLSQNRLSESEARTFFLQISEAIRYLHQDAHIIHCDIKLENVVIASDFSVRLSDFGLSQPQNSQFDSHPPPSGSITYCAPELLAKDVQHNSTQSDIWSLGVLLFAMVSGRFPFSEGFEPRLIAKIRSGIYTMPDDFSPELQTLLRKMLDSNPQNRPTISDVLSSSWCTNQKI